MNSTIKCIHCGKDIEISEAIRHAEEIKIREELKKEFSEKESAELSKLKIELTEQKKKEEALKEKELEFTAEKKKLEEKEKELDAQVAKKIEEEKKKNDQIIEVLEKQKKEDAVKIREEAQKEAADKTRLEKLEFEKKINDMQKALEDAQRKGKQGSQQLQGEVLELDLEEKLKSQFPQDEFLPVPKGIEGADIWQKVNDRNGKNVGSILWETKRTKNWDKKWLPKLREDARRVTASDTILVSEVLPNETKSFGYVEKVWITSYEMALHVARIVRFMLLKIDAVKSSASHEDQELKEIFDYITSDSFKHKIEAHDEAVKTMKEDLNSEIRLTQTRWKRREIQLARLDSSVSQLYGELQGIIPTLGDRSAPEITSGENDID
jgi:hypothetical protein